MNRTDAPAKQGVPFGVNGNREPIESTTPAGDNSASYDVGFPPITMILKSAGGLPPKGQDMNQILYELSALARWFSAGALNSFDATFAASIGGYPKGSVLVGSDGTTPFMSTIEANSNDPNTTPTGWLDLSKIMAIAGLAGGANKLPYFNGTNTAAQTDLTSVGRDIIGKTTLTSLLDYLGMAKAAVLNSTSGYIRLAPVLFGGVIYTPILQWQRVNTSAAGTVVANLPIPYPNGLLFGVAGESQPTGWLTNSATAWGFDSVNSNAIQVAAYVRNIAAGSVAGGTASGIIVTLGF